MYRPKDPNLGVWVQASPCYYPKKYPDGAEMYVVDEWPRLNAFWPSYKELLRNGN